MWQKQNVVVFRGLINCFRLDDYHPKDVRAAGMAVYTPLLSGVSFLCRRLLQREIPETKYLVIHLRSFAIPRRVLDRDFVTHGAGLSVSAMIKSEV